MFARRIPASLCSLILVSTAALAQLPRTWVASTGVDTNSCTRAQPCRNFSAAITAVALGGEVVALDSAGYGPVVVNKPVTLISPAAIHAAIAPTAGNAITVSSGLDGPVIVRGLYLNGQGAVLGIRHEGNDPLFVEETIINGFQSHGLFFAFETSPIFFVTDSTMRNNLGAGIHWSGSFPGRGVVERSRLEKNGASGMEIYNSGNFAARDTLAANNNYGFQVFANGAALDIATSNAVNNANSGFAAISVGAAGVNINLERCLASRNNSGVLADAPQGSATIRVSNSTLTNNDFGVFLGSGTSSILSRVNNTLENNGSGNTFPGTYTAK